MLLSLEKRFSNLRQSIEGVKAAKGFSLTYEAPPAERHATVPINGWHNRILSEIDFCLQMKAHADVDVSAAVENALTVLEMAQKVDGVLTDAVCEQAEQCLFPLIEEAHSYTLLMVGHAHLDMNWMWGWDETVATVVATFKTVLHLMEEYSTFCFSQSQASTYKIIEDYAPELMPEIKQRIREGRWEVTASAWVEQDKNLPCLESLMNHIVYTKQYLKEHWDINPASLDIDFSPDTFGHSAFLPELDQLGGVKYYYHCRGIDAPDKILYRWRAPSGKELLMYREPYWYNSEISPRPAIGLPRVAKMCGGLRTGLAVYGVGDHGGGPTRSDLNRALEMQKWPVFPIIRFARLHDYFEVAESVRDKVPMVEQELNSIFTGCYTTQSRLKKGNRRAETALIGAETLSALTARELGTSYDARSFEKAWQNTLFTHFHDILPGSCVQDSREYSMGLYQDALSIANTRSAYALEALVAAIDTSSLTSEPETLLRGEGAGVGYNVTQGSIPTRENGVGMTRILHVINTTDVDRYENADLTVWDWQGDLNLMEVVDAEGNPLPFEQTSEMQAYWGHDYFTFSVTVKVPAYGYTTVVLREKDPAEVTDCFINTVAWERQHREYDDIVLENDYLLACFDGRNGELISLVDKKTGAERLQKGETGGLRYIKAQQNRMNAWVIDRYLSVEKVAGPIQMNLVGGSLKSGIRTEHRVANSRVTTTVTLGKKDRFLKVQLHVDWAEHSVENDIIPVLSYCLPLAACSDQMLCDVPGGVQWRQERDQDVPCLRYGATVFSDDRLLALASDSKHGFRFSHGELFVTLINTANYPDPYPERGIHDITLLIAVSDNNPVMLNNTVTAGLNPLQYITNTSHKGTLPTEDSLMKVSGETVVFTGIAQRDGYLAIRMHETVGKECPITVILHSPADSARFTDLFGNTLDLPVKVEGCCISATLLPYMQAELRI